MEIFPDGPVFFKALEVGGTDPGRDPGYDLGSQITEAPGPEA